MPSKYPVCTPDEVISVLKKAGFVWISQKGSHAIVNDKTLFVLAFTASDFGR